MPLRLEANGDGMNAPLLEVKDLKKHFAVKRSVFGGAKRLVRAVDGVSFTIRKGETLSIVGESGCGKSTIARAVLRLIDVTSGEVLLSGSRIDRISQRALRPLRRQVQVVFQDPYSSLNPRMRVRDILAEPIRNFRLAANADELNKKIEAVIDLVRLPRDALSRRPHEFSGGQRQRIGIARALAAEPDLIICDEAVSALDVSIKAQIVNLLQDLQQQLGLALLFISHDLAIVEHMTQRVAVMYLGRIVEIGTREQIFSAPMHPYTQALFSAVPVLEPGAPQTRIILKGEIPSASNPPAGCHFHTRCPYAFERCRSARPELRQVTNLQFAACHLHDLPPPENPMLKKAG
jgi:peptide/nickel transport system ATP-binding protein